MKKSASFIAAVFICLFTAATGTAQSIIESQKLIGVFDGRTPCQELAKQLDEIVTNECIKIKWRLKLFGNLVSENQGTGRFTLEGFHFRKERSLSGDWYTTTGTASDKNTLVYHLQLKDKGELLLQKGSDNVLFFLDTNSNLRVGNRDFSYTLNRISDAH